ncbi:MAG: ECF transporter S component [Cellulosilyticaceae bacterium]
MEQKQVRLGLSKRTLVASVFILLLIPLTILFGIYVLDDRKYYFISMLIILYTMIPFFMIFESRGPRAREIVLLAVMVAIGVAGRSAFFMVPQFKPVVAIVIITGVCLGAESGFLVGALTGFVSNFFFGQGPWTVWQMFCFGIIGFIAGILFQKGILKKERVPLCLYGGLATFFIYGGIINIGSMMMATGTFNFKVLLGYYISAVWFDVIHALATVVFLALLSQPMIEKLERIKIKYGLIETH